MPETVHWRSHSKSDVTVSWLRFDDAEMTSYLQLGPALPGELCILALERALMDVQC